MTTIELITTLSELLVEKSEKLIKDYKALPDEYKDLSEKEKIDLLATKAEYVGRLAELDNVLEELKAFKAVESISKLFL